MILNFYSIFFDEIPLSVVPSGAILFAYVPQKRRHALLTTDSLLWQHTKNTVRMRITLNESYKRSLFKLIFLLIDFQNCVICFAYGRVFQINSVAKCLEIMFFHLNAFFE